MPSRVNVFAGAFMDRMAHRRDDKAWVEQMLAAPETRFLPLWNSHNLLSTGDAPRGFYLTREEAGIGDGHKPVLLDTFDGQTCFAVDWGTGERDGAPRIDGGEWHGLRTVGALVAAEEAGVLAYARAMVLWHRRHRYCGFCGSRTRRASAGHLRICSNQACGEQQFPRIDPAIIVLVSNGDRCLLGRQPGWPKGRYSTIAGFVEPGEGLEDAVVREVYEETGIELETVRYHSSQPWPFPSSLMLGFRATAASTEIERHDQELEDARWFSRRDLISGFPVLSPSLSIAYRLTEDWFDEGDEGRLAEHLSRASERW